MPREYQHIKLYEKEIFELKEQGLSQRQIGEQLGIPYKRYTTFSNDTTEHKRKCLREQD